LNTAGSPAPLLGLPPRFMASRFTNRLVRSACTASCFSLGHVLHAAREGSNCAEHNHDDEHSERDVIPGWREPDADEQERADRRVLGREWRELVRRATGR
jgi:hypothetical protein